MVDLPMNNTDTLTMFNDLYTWRWLDRATRAVILELSTLNVNTSLTLRRASTRSATNIRTYLKSSRTASVRTTRINEVTRVVRRHMALCRRTAPRIDPAACSF